MRMLAVTYGLPWPLTEGAKIRDYHLLREASQAAEVVLLSFCKDDPDHPDPGPLRTVCAAAETYAPPRRRGWREAAAHWRSGRPLATFPFYFEKFAQRIRSLAENHRVDFVQIEHSFLAPYRTAIPSGCRAILSLHNIGELQYSSMAKLPGSGLPSRVKAAAMRDWEADWASRFDHCIAVSADEAAWVRQRAPQLPLTVVENGVDCIRLQPLPPAADGNRTILFVGTLGYPPNADAVVEFARHALPQLQRSLPGVKLVAVGRNPRPEIRALRSEDGIEVHDDVPDVLPLYERSSVVVVPLRAGGGTRLKILEAMALGRPVVSTPKGCEGLEVAHQDQLLIADLADMPRQVERVLEDSTLAKELSARARRWVEARHDWRIPGARLRRVHRQLAGCASEAVS